MKKIRLVLIEDNRLLREGINSILKKEPDINVVEAYGDTELVLEEITGLKPDVVLLDLGLANQNSLELVKSLKDSYPEVKIIAMDLIPVQEDILRFVEAGVSGFILKDATTADFTKTIRSVACGEKILPPMLTGSLFSQIMDYGIKEMGPVKLIKSVRMTKREREIVELIAEGLANKEIAYKLNISIYTVKSHVHNILEKMALNTRVQIAIHARTSESPGI
ncbi:MAG: DNA-binding response regulator [Ignavibacteriae bacterium]|nr:MAG: DNA-binding response regulator [Ignavibacteriota bacterium]